MKLYLLVFQKVLLDDVDGHVDLAMGLCPISVKLLVRDSLLGVHKSDESNAVGARYSRNGGGHRKVVWR